MPPVFVKLGPCDGMVRPRWWVVFEWPQPCGRPSGHPGEHRRLPQRGDSFVLCSDPTVDLGPVTY